MSASDCARRSASLAGAPGWSAWALSPRICMEGCTLRKVTGSRAAPSPSANRSTMAKGAAANLAKGGMAPVAAVIGKLSAFCKDRPAASRNSLGNSIVNFTFSGRTVLNSTRFTRVSPSASSLSKLGFRLSLPTCRRTPCACARVTGALKFRLTGRIARQSARAFSRSQLKLAMNGSRTVNSKRRCTELVTLPAAVAEVLATTRPLPTTN